MVGYSALSQRNEMLAIELIERPRRLMRGILGRIRPLKLCRSLAEREK